MSRFITALLGVTFFIMTTSANATRDNGAGQTLLLETSQGQVEIKMLLKLAPKRRPITELASNGFYDGIIFHRVIPGFMAQTGDPDGTGMGGSGQKLEAEFTDYQYREGTVGMARSMNPNSGDSQFFICFGGCGHLTGQYTVGDRLSVAWTRCARLPLASHLPTPTRSSRQASSTDRKPPSRLRLPNSDQIIWSLSLVASKWRTPGAPLAGW